MLLALKEEKGALSQGTWSLYKQKKAREHILIFREEYSPANSLILGQSHPRWTSVPQNGSVACLCRSEPLSWWWFVKVIEDWYKQPLFSSAPKPTNTSMREHGAHLSDGFLVPGGTWSTAPGHQWKLSRREEWRKATQGWRQELTPLGLAQGTFTSFVTCSLNHQHWVPKGSMEHAWDFESNKPRFWSCSTNSVPWRGSA